MDPEVQGVYIVLNQVARGRPTGLLQSVGGLRCDDDTVVIFLRSRASHVGGKKFDELWSTNKEVLEVHTLTHPSGVDILRETTFPPLGAAAPSNFYTL